jgi:glutamine synthetase
MAKEQDKAMKMIEDAEYVMFRFCDTLGKLQQVCLKRESVGSQTFEKGVTFDGSSILGWKSIESSDMIMLPDLDSIYRDPFIKQPTVAIHCDIKEPSTYLPYNRDPRGVAQRARTHLKQSGIGDEALFGPELEFFVFDSVRWKEEPSGCLIEINSDEGVWAESREDSLELGPNLGHRPGTKGGYFPAAPIDSLVDMRNEMSDTLWKIGIEAEMHHHEVGTAGQCEISTKYSDIVRRGDVNMIQKYVVQNVAREHDKTATFMPKPIAGDNGSGMHVHQSITKDGRNLFVGKEYGGLSKEALYYIGGILKHSQAINAFTNPTTNSYKRLIPGYEAPICLAYSERNRSASIRIPFDPNPKARRIEVRYPDPLANPYLAFSAMLMAGLDGIKNKIDPGKPVDRNLFDLTPKEEKRIRKVATTLHDALAALDRDREFLTGPGVFDDDMIDAYIALKRPEVMAFRSAPHPVEFKMYYSL